MARSTGPSLSSVDRASDQGAFIDGLYQDCAYEPALITGRGRAGRREIKRGSDLFNSGDRCDLIYSLIEGWVALYHLMEDGRRQILQFAMPGAILSFDLEERATMTYSALAMTDVVVSTTRYGDMARLCREDPRLGLRLAFTISRDRNLAYEHLANLGRRSARARVAYLLLELFVRQRLLWPGHRSDEMHLPLTQEDIGDASGLTGVHVNRVLQGLRKQEIVEFHYRRLRILNPDALVDAAAVDTSWLLHRSYLLPACPPHDKAHQSQAIVGYLGARDAANGSAARPPRHP